MSHHPLPITVETTVGGVRLVLQTGQVARQAHGAVIATLGGTMCFAAACVGPQRDDIDFFPLTVDYREKTEAAGKIPGGFFKREGRPTTKETLTMRLIDRAIRPLFPDEFTREVQVMSHTLSYDGSTNPDVCAMIAAFAAVRISGVPFKATLGAVRIGHLDGKLCAFPPDERRREESRLDLVVAAHKAGFNMVESSAKELSEEPGAKESAGDLGFFTKDRMVPEFANAAFSQKVGDISQPVRTQFGWHVIKVTETKPAGTVPFPEVKDQITGYLKSTSQREAVQEVLKKLKESAKIETFLPTAG